MLQSTEKLYTYLYIPCPIKGIREIKKYYMAINDKVFINLI